ncbi:MAG: phosphodiester glycosidase family protein [Eubacteriales bacterium]|nr:phosphodiester glycosidase family protein [Eubacteriales bacterium]MDD3881019.1 phosphodiester glycosidase family protein [Eubacteriales bacterium]MDD4511912.1 phosphodiester glycosidase family protein [Eubacteriales bacterium]
MTTQSRRRRRKKLWPVWALVLADVLAAAVALNVFALFDHVIPRPEANVNGAGMGAYRTAAINNTTPQPAITDNLAAIAATDTPAPEYQALAATEQPATEAPTEYIAPVVTAEPAATDIPADAPWSVKFADKFTSGQPYYSEDGYVGNTVSVYLSRHSEKKVTYADKVIKNLAYYVMDIYVSNIECLRTAFANDTYGVGITQRMSEMSRNNAAIAAINGDYCGFNKEGLVIRNGVLFRNNIAKDRAVLVLFYDGTMKAYKPDEVNVDELLSQGAWQAWNFGPSLLAPSGNAIAEFTNNSSNPRTIIGMVEPGHYMFVLIDGRQDGYSDGMSYVQMSELCKRLGMKVAYNLDGGQTSQMFLNGENVNQPYNGGRVTSDIVFVTER